MIRLSGTLLRGHHDNSGGTVALLLKAGNAQVLRNARVVHALEILVGGIEPTAFVDFSQARLSAPTIDSFTPQE